MNQVILIGNAGGDAEYRTTESGTPVCQFAMATTTYWRDKDGNRQKAPQWHYCKAWRDMAEKCSNVRKGDRLFVVGEIKSETRDVFCSECNAPMKRKYTYIDVRSFSISIKIDYNGKDAEGNEDAQEEAAEVDVENLNL